MDGSERGGQSGQGGVVGTHDGIGEIFIIDQDDVGGKQSHRLGDLELLDLQGDRQPVGAHQCAVPVEGVQADDERVRTQHRLPGGQVGALLADRQRDDPPLVDDQLIADDGGTRGVQPGSGPVPHVPA